MRKFIILLFFIISTSMFAQDISGIKHVEIVSELQDSMVLLNKMDINKINKVFFENKKLDSLNTYNNHLSQLLKQEIVLQSSIISEQTQMLKNEAEINKYLKQSIIDSETLYQKQLKKERSKKIGWQTATGLGIVGIILALVLK